jgi:hypothetical protein
MKTLRFPLLALALAALASLFGGCTLNSQKNSSIPWSRPAAWEGQIPGMGTTPGQAR